MPAAHADRVEDLLKVFRKPGFTVVGWVQPTDVTPWHSVGCIYLKRSAAQYRLEVVSRPAGKRGFVKLPRRWVVERTFAWLGWYRHNSRDYERYEHSSEAMLEICSVNRMLRLLKPDSTKSNPLKYRELEETNTG